MLRSLREIPESYENLAWKLFAAFLKGHRQVDTVADKCKEIPIKSGERGGRSCWDDFYINQTQRYYTIFTV